MNLRVRDDFIDIFIYHFWEHKNAYLKFRNYISQMNETEFLNIYGDSGHIYHQTTKGKFLMFEFSKSGNFCIINKVEITEESR